MRRLSRPFVLSLVLASAAACGEGDEAPSIAPVPAEVEFAVVGGDFSSSSIGLLDGSGDVSIDVWFDARTTEPGLVSALSGDCTLASRQLDDTVLIIDRLGVDVLTHVSRDGTLLGQLRLNPPPGDVGFSSNPQDAVMIDASEGWASRYETNLDPAAAEADRGNDVVAFDPSTMLLTGDRVDLSVFDVTVTGLDDQGDAVDVDVLARPHGLAMANGHLVVGLELLPADFYGARGHGEGRVAIIDLADLELTSYELTGLANCSHVENVAGEPDEVIVACLGYSDVGFAEEAGNRATTGIARLAIADDGEVTELSSWRASDDAESALASWNVVSLGGDEVVGIAFGDFVAGTDDRLFHIDLATGTQTEIATAAGQYVLGQGAFDGESLLVVPDAAGVTGAVRRFDTSAGFAEGEPVLVGPATLPPRSIHRL